MTATITPVDAAVASLVQALADNLDPVALHAAVQQALRDAEALDGAARLTAGHGHLFADPVTGEVWAGEACGSAADSLQYGIAHVAAALVAGVRL